MTPTFRARAPSSSSISSAQVADELRPAAAAPDAARAAARWFGWRLATRRRMQYAVRFTNVEVLAGVVGKPSRLRFVAPILFALALAALCFAVSRPHVGARAERQGTVILVLDVSGSMQAEDVKPTRLAAAQRAIHIFLDKVPGNVRVGLVLFAGTPIVATPPTTDHDLVGGLSTRRATSIRSAAPRSATRSRPPSGSAARSRARPEDSRRSARRGRLPPRASRRRRMRRSRSSSSRTATRTVATCRRCKVRRGRRRRASRSTRSRSGRPATRRCADAHQRRILLRRQRRDAAASATGSRPIRRRCAPSQS